MKKKKTLFVGAATALVTPMNDDLSVDFGAFGRLIDFQIDSGINALLVLGTTGEASTLTDDERKKITLFAAEKVSGRVPLIVGAGSNDTRRAVAFSSFAAKNGADAVLSVTPYYNKTTDAGLIRHFTHIADECEKPVILYNIPARTGMNISLPVYKELTKHENIIAVKEASGNIDAICELISSVGSGLRVYSGNDSETVPIMASGGIGVFSVLSNIMPAEVVRLTSLLSAGKTSDAAALSSELCGLTKALFCETNPIPIKAACEMMRLCSDNVREPLCKISDKNSKILKKELKKHGLI